MATRDTTDAELMDELSRFYADPLGYVMFSFPWDTESAIKLVKLKEPWRSRFNCEYGPDAWACEFLDDLGAEIRARNFDGRTAVEAIQFATASGHGIGKSTLVAWLIKFIMDTRPFCKGTITAMTDTQLRTKTWAELGKWHRLSLTEHLFDYGAGRGSMALRHKMYPQEWFCAAQTARKENSEAFAGQHAANSTSFYIFDEASGIEEIIYEVREGGLTDGEPMVFDFGNPTRNSGRFYDECIGRLKDLFKVRCIDSRSVEITNKEKAERDIATWGEDSDFVRVRIKGQFPKEGSTQFVSGELVDDAMTRPLAVDKYAPLVLGVDVARFGDDESVIYPRIGNDARSFPPIRYRELDSIQLAGKVISIVKRFRNLGLPTSAIFVDGTGVGSGVVDQLRHLGYNPVDVQFGASPTDKLLYRYKSDEMWGKMREALRFGLCLPGDKDPDGRDLRQQLTQREFGYTVQGNKIHLEPKSDMKKRLGQDASPDIADALALTFAQDVAPVRVTDGEPAYMTTKFDYDPLQENW